MIRKTSFITAAILFPFLLFSQSYSMPENSPAKVQWDGQNMTLTYDGKTMLQGWLENPESLDYFNVLEDTSGQAVTQVIQLVSRKEELRFTATVYGSYESFPCEAERREDAPLLIRHSVGLSHSLLNRAVYDRGYDWLLSVDFPTAAEILPERLDDGRNAYLFELSGHSLILRFRPHYYQRHKGLEYFEPWNYSIKKNSVAGWCSWFAFYNQVTEEDIHRTAEVLAGTLVPYGLEYLQIDDGYQQVPIGEPERWLNANEKFPSGMPSLAEYISSKGMVPGIWTNVSFANQEFVVKNPNFFVKNDVGKPAYGNWVGYVMDASNHRTIEQLITPVYEGFAQSGWRYFKLDALRHLRYEGYNSHADYFEKKGLDREKVFRGVVQEVRSAIGDDSYLMGCWGIRPELIGIIDACRIGDDGFGYGGLAEYNSFNNVVWRNDPDHIELTEAEAYRSTMVTSLTGSLYMLTDKPEVYRGPLAEAARRTMPVLFTVPGQVYEVDPSRIANLGKVNTEVSGGGPRSFDADQAEYCHLYLQEINTEFENWMVLGRTGERLGDWGIGGLEDWGIEGMEDWGIGGMEDWGIGGLEDWGIGGLGDLGLEEIGLEEIGLEDLGLRKDSKYLVFEFWTKTLLGVIEDKLIFPPIDSTYRCQAFCIREKLDHPQIIATSRHISCGAYELEYVRWRENEISGASRLTPFDPYNIYIYEPEGYRLAMVTGTGTETLGHKKQGNVRVITLKSSTATTAHWIVTYIHLE